MVQNDMKTHPESTGYYPHRNSPAIGVPMEKQKNSATEKIQKMVPDLRKF